VFPENEFFMMTIAGMIGMEVPVINLVDLDSIAGIPEGIGELKGQALAISRFDRTIEGPVHTEDFAQVFGVFPDDKYKRASYANIGLGNRRLILCAPVPGYDQRSHGRIWARFGFVDAFSESRNWYAKTYLAINQGPIVAMIENCRSALLWNLFMGAPEVQAGRLRLAFNSPHLGKTPAGITEDSLSRG
jgi:hypothetical protein